MHQSARMVRMRQEILDINCGFEQDATLLGACIADILTTVYVFTNLAFNMVMSTHVLLTLHIY